MALYDTRFGLPQGVADYLNQGLPSISGIFPPVAGINPIKPSPDDPVVGLPYYKDEPMPQPSDGDGFSPYDIRPGDSSIRTFDQYSPYAYNQAMRIGQTVGPNPDLYYAPLTDIEQLLNKLPTFGGIKKGLDALADKLPVNRTAIFQNELLGGGFMLDDIGRIVTDNYNTPEGIMAGYNPVSGGLLNMLTGGKYGEPTTYGLDKSYDQRRETIADTLRDKYGMSEPEITAALKGEYTGPVKTPLINRLSLFNQSQEMLNTRKQMADIVTKREEEKRAKEEQQRQQQRTREIAEANKAAGDRGGYQSSWGQDRGGGDFMGGKGTSAEMGSF
jgi:hypothetical protein